MNKNPPSGQTKNADFFGLRGRGAADDLDLPLFEPFAIILPLRDNNSVAYSTERVKPSGPLLGQKGAVPELWAAKRTVPPVTDDEQE